MTSSHPFHLRGAETSDLPAILALWSAMMKEHETFDPRIRLAGGAMAAYEAYVRHHLGRSDSLVRLAVDAARDEPIAFLLLTIQRNLPMFLPPYYGYLSDLAVARERRRQGVGRALVQDARRWLAARRIDTLQLQAYRRNEEAAAFWKAMGLVPYYDRMWLTLDA